MSGAIRNEVMILVKQLCLVVTGSAQIPGARSPSPIIFYGGV